MESVHKASDCSIVFVLLKEGNCCVTWFVLLRDSNCGLCLVDNVKVYIILDINEVYYVRDTV